MRTAQTLGQRIREAREKAQMTQLDISTAMGLSRAAVAQWESDTTSPSIERVGQIAKMMGLAPEFLAYGVTDEPVIVVKAPEGTILVKEVVFGDKQTDMIANGEWSLPSAYLKGDLRVLSTEGVIIFRVESDTLAPAWEYGDRVIVDTNARRPSPPGTFLIWDGVGPALANISIAQVTGGKQVARVSTGADSYETPIDKLQIIGRVKGRLHSS